MTAVRHGRAGGRARPRRGDGDHGRAAHQEPGVRRAMGSPAPIRSSGASCMARLEKARREFIRRVPDSVAGSVEEQDDGTLTYIACEGDPPEVDCDMHATIAPDPRATAKAPAHGR